MAVVPSGRPGDNAHVAAVLERGFSVLTTPVLPEKHPDLFKDFFTTYNRTPVQEQAREWLLLAGVARSLAGPGGRIALVGAAADGPNPLLVTAAYDAVAVDARGQTPHDEATLLRVENFVPGMLAAGGYEGAVLLGNHARLLIHNTAGKWAFPHADRMAVGGKGPRITLTAEALPEQSLIDWLAQD
jgi:hypothetical protein